MEEENMVEVEVKNVVDEGAVAVEEVVPTPEATAFAEAAAAAAEAATPEAFAANAVARFYVPLAHTTKAAEARRIHFRLFHFLDGLVT